ncbi:heme NO-binding domain-containing protein [Pseudoponticoccus marisrubri]|nr:heme NO-binding domain-containing protein [Pseudoponticoccus marisrubri]
MVFTELLDMAERVIGEDGVDEVLDSLDLDSGGAYSAVGNYPCRELMQIVGALSDRTGLAGDDLQRQFGGWMLQRFSRSYPQFFADKTCPLQMLDAIDNEVHVEVRKLYPDAELPRFVTEWLGPEHMRMTYRSERPLMAFCHGLIEACMAHFDARARIEVLAAETGKAAVFDIRLER